MLQVSSKFTKEVLGYFSNGIDKGCKDLVDILLHNGLCSEYGGRCTIIPALMQCGILCQLPNTYSPSSGKSAVEGWDDMEVRLNHPKRAWEDELLFSDLNQNGL